MEELTGFGMKDCLSFSGLGWNYFNSLRTEQDEPIYTYIDKYHQMVFSTKCKRRSSWSLQPVL